jgi:hypothetical protein
MDLEVEQLVVRLRQLILAPRKSWQVEFTEPNLSFRFNPSSGDGFALEIGFDDAFHPERRTYSEEPYWISMRTSAVLIEVFAGELEKELKDVRR